jgi:hypothetical protein
VSIPYDQTRLLPHCPPRYDPPSYTTTDYQFEGLTQPILCLKSASVSATAKRTSLARFCDDSPITSPHGTADGLRSDWPSRLAGLGISGQVSLAPASHPGWPCHVPPVGSRSLPPFCALRFLVENRALIEGRSVLELGAGCGLAGLVASQLASSTLLTDGNDVVLELLARNIERQQELGLCKGDLRAVPLLWGSEGSVAEVLEGGAAPDVLIGADIVCWPNYVGPLLQTVKAIMLRSADPLASRLYLGFVCRALHTKRLFFKGAEDMGMAIEVLQTQTEVEGGGEGGEEKLVQPMEILRVQLDPASPVCMDPPVFEIPPLAFSAPC